MQFEIEIELRSSILAKIDENINIAFSGPILKWFDRHCFRRHYRFPTQTRTRYLTATPPEWVYTSSLRLHHLIGLPSQVEYEAERGVRRYIPGVSLHRIANYTPRQCVKHERLINDTRYISHAVLYYYRSELLLDTIYHCCTEIFLFTWYT